MIHKILALPLLILMGSFVMAEDTPQTLFDFTGADSAKEWQTVNDGVMGGVSEGKFTITEKKTLEFLGTLSLAPPANKDHDHRGNSGDDNQG